MQFLIQYMYGGEVNVPYELLPSFICAAERLQIRGLNERVNECLEAVSTEPIMVEVNDNKKRSNYSDGKVNFAQQNPSKLVKANVDENKEMPPPRYPAHGMQTRRNNKRPQFSYENVEFASHIPSTSMQSNTNKEMPPQRYQSEELNETPSGELVKLEAECDSFFNEDQTEVRYAPESDHEEYDMEVEEVNGMFNGPLANTIQNNELENDVNNNVQAQAFGKISWVLLVSQCISYIENTVN